MSLHISLAMEYLLIKIYLSYFIFLSGNISILGLSVFVYWKQTKILHCTMPQRIYVQMHL